LIPLRIRVLPSLGDQRRRSEIRPAEVDQWVEDVALDLEPDYAVVPVRVHAADVGCQRNLPLGLAGRALGGNVDDGEREREDYQPHQGGPRRAVEVDERVCHFSTS